MREECKTLFNEERERNGRKTVEKGKEMMKQRKKYSRR
jgi:hypothetical protein